MNDTLAVIERWTIYVCEECHAPQPHHHARCPLGHKGSFGEAVEVIPLTTFRGAVEALAELVRLKDGPRDDAYRAAKDAAWDAARSIVGGQS